MTDLGFDWNLLDQIKLRECEIRLRNANALRETMSEQLLPFAEVHALNLWATARSFAIEIATAAEACRDEYQAIITDATKIVIPDSRPKDIERRKAVTASATTALEFSASVLANITIVIDGEDALSAS